MKQCPYCNTQIADDSRFCTECGKPIPQGSVCPHCGALTKEGDAFCSNCGKSLNEDVITTDPTEVKEEYAEGERKSGFKKYLPYIFGAIVVLAIIGYFIFKDSKGGNDSAALTNLTTEDSATVDRVIIEQKMLTIDDIVEFLNLMEGTSDLTNQAKSNYQNARPSIEAIAKRNGFTMYEYHYVNGDLGQGEMSSYCCYLYKNCDISTDDTGYPTFTPTNNGVCCVLSRGEITVYDKDSYDELVRQIKEKCENKLYSEIEGDGEESHYYSDGKYRYYMVSEGYRIPIWKQVY